MDYWTGLCFVNFLIVVSGSPDSTHFYSVDLDMHPFEAAQTLCASDGSLANMPDSEETSKILKVIQGKGDNTSTSFWIGLKKDKKKCVQKDFPLKGFHWIVDNSTKSDLEWKEEPSGTCTSALCGILSVEYRGSTIANWGLAAKSCTKKFPFICKHKGLSKNIACSSQPLIFGRHDITNKMMDPSTLWVSCNGTDTFTLTCSKSTGEWKLVGGSETDIEGLCLECEKGYKKNKDGICVDIDECKQSNNCKFNCINTQGSYSCLYVDDMNNVHSEDSEIFKKTQTATDATNKVQDKPTSYFMDKKYPPSSQPATYSTTESAVLIEQSTGDLSNIVFPLIIALLIFVVLVVIIVAIVKYCLMRSARKQAKKRAAALKESVALNGSDSMEKVNE
ncbi:C-type lectin domain family 14 member A [Pangasianodon hypophthalmus]|uniref:C-type lectin domain family 14 member A n=1 Tax=Pangasianodon hypophthalmus TaxID=310915 RepID=UPI000EFF8A2F|nr:C-type lectin domain family 14 member A [Pangasianodon hypophthalmus]